MKLTKEQKRNSTGVLVAMFLMIFLASCRKDEETNPCKDCRTKITYHTDTGGTYRDQDVTFEDCTGMGNTATREQGNWSMKMYWVPGKEDSTIYFTGEKVTAIRCQ